MSDNCEVMGCKPIQQADLDSPEYAERLRKCWLLLLEGKLDFNNPQPWEDYANEMPKDQFE
jgi:hypothetical protein